MCSSGSPHDRADAHPRAGDLGDRRGEQQLGAGLLQVPAEPAQRRAVELGRRAGRPRCRRRTGRTTSTTSPGPPSTGSPSEQSPAPLVRRQAAADDPVAETGLPPQLLVQGGDAGRRARPAAWSACAGRGRGRGGAGGAARSAAPRVSAVASGRVRATAARGTSNWPAQATSAAPPSTSAAPRKTRRNSSVPSQSTLRS